MPNERRLTKKKHAKFRKIKRFLRFGSLRKMPIEIMSSRIWIDRLRMLEN